jgi:predicted CoA-binding protein
MPERVVIVGASPHKERYSNTAQRLLMEIGCCVIPLSLGHALIEEVAVTRTLSEIQGVVDTVTMYVNPTLSAKLQDELIKCKPRRVILNPGTESPALATALRENGIEVIEACTLELIRTGQW